MFAEVAVHTPMARRMPPAARPEASSQDAPLGLTFHYAVPEQLQAALLPGHLVWAPFGKQQLQGVVLNLTDHLPEGVAARPLDDLVLPEPVLTPAQLSLARWLSEHTLASILDCLLLMLPPGLAQRAEPVLALTAHALASLAQDPPPAGDDAQQMSFAGQDFATAQHGTAYFPQFPSLKPEQHRLIGLLQRRGQVAVSSLHRQTPELARRSVVEPLIEAGLLSRQQRIVEPPLRAKTGKQVTLLADEHTVSRVLPTLGKASKQADALAWLAAHRDQRPTVAEVCEAAGCSPAPLRSLADRGWIRIDPDHTIALLLPDDAIADRLIELRGGQKYRRVLEALAANPDRRPVWLGWLYAEADTDLTTVRELAAAGLVSLDDVVIWRDPLAGKEFVADQAPPLTEDQAAVWAQIEQGITGRRAPDTDHAPAVYLLHGVTGSGKTEIYLRAIEATLRSGRQALALVPEIALTPQTVRRFAARFGGRVTVYHSGLSSGERFDVWRRARAGEVGVVVGTRSALFLPLPRLGLIILDEEHDPSYKESQRAPRYHAREAARQLARLTGAALILGSATPSLETYYAAQLGQIHLLEMPRRIMGHAQAIAEQQQRLHLTNTVYHPLPVAGPAQASQARFTELPQVQVVDLRQELRAGNRSIFSRPLQQAMEQVLAAGQQAILFLNRRGSATFVMCRDCGHVLTCDRCDVPLTYHESAAGALVCHHCGQRTPAAERCPECQSRRIRHLGAGTEKIAELVQTLWPAARVVRWDRDVTMRKGSHDAILEQFVARQANVMVGTQMIAKGLDLPLVTLVGVISADVGLYLPDFRAAERSFQLLTQVAGRAGRSLLGGKVIIQSYRPEHYAIQAARRHDYSDFYRQELSFRRQLGYPPFRRLARLIFLHGDRERAKAEAEALARGLRFAIHERGLSGADLIGPAPCFFGREGGQYRWHIAVRAADPVALLRDFPIPPGWRVDIDPISFL